MALADVLGKPRVYNGISIHPVRIADCEEFYDSVTCLMIPKNVTQDVEILRMSYLYFLMAISVGEYSYLYDKLISLLKLVLKTDNIQLALTDKQKFEIIVDDKHIIRERDFDKIKTIISEQNLIDIDDEFVHPEVQKQIDAARAYKARKANKTASIEQQIVAYHCMAKGMLYEDIAKLTIYQFQSGLSRFDHILGAEAIMNAKYSGFATFKDETSLPHWLSHIESVGKDSNIKLDANKFISETQNKLKN